ncbi:hypothetical protein BIW11_04926 [Tropilaelaps mercedesae]|uniref:Uncharacterized protein n=1 Tax=Tropilaelaps mercedesae TaxID=418985 RepID=A0A1V9WZL8_9ACAR|nr:hypothetical protein BIW11_04926 [Tropilaelaps mercedesae]
MMQMANKSQIYKIIPRSARQEQNELGEEMPLLFVTGKAVNVYVRWSISQNKGELGEEFRTAPFDRNGLTFVERTKQMLTEGRLHEFSLDLANKAKLTVAVQKA